MGDDICTTGPSGGSFVVLVHDPVTDETDAYGPMSEWDAVVDAERRRTELDAEDLADVAVLLVPVQPAPAAGGPGEPVEVPEPSRPVG